MRYDHIEEGDPEIFELMRRESLRQNRTLDLIASENLASEAVLEATGSIFTNKYAEGYPNARYYGGCEVADQVEILAIERAKKLFDADHANVQPHSGSQANQAVYLAFLKPGDTILSMSLAAGGHLSHGAPVSMTGKWFNIVHYGVDPKTETIDLNEVEKLALEHKPKLIIAGASAYPRFIDFQGFREIADKVGAIFMVDMAHIAGLVAAGVHPSPVPFADVVTTTTHKTLRGPRGGLILCKAEHAKAIDKAVFPGVQGGPLVHIIAAKAVAFKEDSEPSFKEYSAQVVKNAKTMAETFASKGVRVVTGGTDNHLMLLDVTSVGLTGKEAEELLAEVGIVVNKNAIPFDKLPPRVASGIRIGTPNITTRGLRDEECKLLAEQMSELFITKSEKVKAEIKGLVQELTERYPAYKGWS
ncbi:serine hydroxymethyltransferase [Coprothermobacter proteolyticus DSM 5265]|uniref:Serine hydroxymethyltransferase n=1 Tax=Coprothermobacter proteolyticus (strain ATCC 35245 / DSM 5265 / OCM 4 / BT) TaxID=309798 RepID=GLYA_COPPD|nr:serine hydroxymethyltransferase [Coprothermobacter proteolyticus]B5Y8G6.1 RecName: Full=Serine hydroxymethyltransferase; Short=SHMT; Short=Serine methylase [Coprothermobacter proteolyticus DSM 5265]ACI17752.1 serine hydroxymethyltransferase [Coprothermobacter proteolyticus DSM 5265]